MSEITKGLWVVAIASAGSVCLCLIVGVWAYGDTDSPPDWWQAWMGISCIIFVLAVVVGIILEVIDD